MVCIACSEGSASTGQSLSFGTVGFKCRNKTRYVRYSTYDATLFAKGGLFKRKSVP
jgi:hypothetical protein